jgi:hypothetical protein
MPVDVRGAPGEQVPGIALLRSISRAADICCGGRPLHLRDPLPPGRHLTALPMGQPAPILEPDTAYPADLSQRAYVMSVMAAILLGVAVRASFVLSSDFPLNDGGLFFAMARDIQANHYALPHVTSYNSSNIPFSYPPLAMYVAALLGGTTPLGMITIFRLVPLITSCVTLYAFFLLARAMLSSKAATVTALLIFALLPTGFTWMIMGGGLTRSLGFMFAIFALRQIYSMYADRQLWRAAPAAVLCALCVTSHAEMAWFTAFSALLFFLGYGRDRAAVRSSLCVAAGTLVLTAPWWGTVIAYHGFAPLIDGVRAGSYPLAGPITLVKFNPTVEPFFSLIAALALLGGLICLVNRQYVLPAWVVAAALLDQRAFARSATLAVALLAAIAIQDVILPLINRPNLRPSLVNVSGHAKSTPSAWLAGAVLAGIVAYTALSALVAAPSLLTGMGHDERSSLQWVADNTPANSRFAVVSEDRWAVDRTSEWFPALTRRQSVATVQGSEWLPDDAFTRQVSRYDGLQSCGNHLSGCLDEWSAASGVSFDYVYLPKIDPRLPAGTTCCEALRTSLSGDPRYADVFDGPGATIFRRK